MFMPHQIVEQRLQNKFDEDIRKHYFRGMEFAGPVGDPGWFGPGSAVWHVPGSDPVRSRDEVELNFA